MDDMNNQDNNGPMGNIKDKAENAKNEVGDAAGNVGEKAKDAGHGIVDKVKETIMGDD